jgi:quinolinate synthase
MNVRKIRRKCGVRGCKNTANTFIISKSREMSNSIALCTDCMRDALASAEKYIEPVREKRPDKPLFPHPELAVTISSVADKEPKPTEVIEEKATEEETIPTAEDTVTKRKVDTTAPKKTYSRSKQEQQKQ